MYWILFVQNHHAILSDFVTVTTWDTNEVQTQSIPCGMDRSHECFNMKHFIDSISSPLALVESNEGCIRSAKATVGGTYIWGKRCEKNPRSTSLGNLRCRLHRDPERSLFVHHNPIFVGNGSHYSLARSLCNPDRSCPAGDKLFKAILSQLAVER